MVAALLAISLQLSALSYSYAGIAVNAPTPKRPLAQPQLPVFFHLPDFTLTDQNGKSVTLKDIKGPWIADFIFTRCSSQCPMMTERAKRIASRAPGARLVSFSLDP